MFHKKFSEEIWRSTSSIELRNRLLSDIHSFQYIKIYKLYGAGWMGVIPAGGSWSISTRHIQHTCNKGPRFLRNCKIRKCRQCIPEDQVTLNCNRKTIRQKFKTTLWDLPPFLKSMWQKLKNCSLVAKNHLKMQKIRSIKRRLCHLTRLSTLDAEPSQWSLQMLRRGILLGSIEAWVNYWNDWVQTVRRRNRWCIKSDWIR